MYKYYQKLLVFLQNTFGIKFITMKDLEFYIFENELWCISSDKKNKRISENDTEIINEILSIVREQYPNAYNALSECTVRAPPLAQFNPIKTRSGASTPSQLPAAINTVYRPKAMMSSQTRTAKSFPREKTQIFAKTGLTFAHRCIIITIVSSEQCVRLATNGFPVFII